MNKHFKSLRMAITLLLLSAAIFSLRPLNAEAASWKAILGRNESGSNSTVKVNGKYFTRDSSGDIYWSKSKKGNRNFICKSYSGIATNGSKVLYLDCDYTNPKVKLMSYTCSTGKNKKLKSLSLGSSSADPDSYSIDAAYGDGIYLTRSSFSKWKYSTYRYDVSSGKLKITANNTGICDQSGKYVVVTHEYRSDVSACRISVYKLTSSGMTKVCKIAEHGFRPTYIGKYLYYTSSPNNMMNQITICRRSVSGSNLKKYKTIKSSSSYGQVAVYEFGKTSCKIYKDGCYWQFTYKTGKLKKID